MSPVNWNRFTEIDAYAPNNRCIQAKITGLNTYYNFDNSHSNNKRKNDKMGKKKVKPNGFGEFMHEIIEKERRAGRRHPKEQWAAVAKPYWEKLSEEEKGKYKQQAKTKPPKFVVVPPKYTAQGVPLDQIGREQKELAEKKHYMERKVNSMVENAFLNNDIQKKDFVFIMANYFYKTDSGDYSPAEIAVAKFNFQDGIHNSYHTFVNPETIAIGYASRAKDHSERFHRLPPPSTKTIAMGETNFQKIYLVLLEVLGVPAKQQENFVIPKTDARRPCVFIRKQDIESIESILDQLSLQSESYPHWTQLFDVFELELLFNKLKNKVIAEDIKTSVTNGFIEQDRYDATPNISCDFHEKEDATRHCAYSYVRRWFFLFADHICEGIGVEIVPGKHVPQNTYFKPAQSDFKNNDGGDDDDWEQTGASYADFSTHTGYSKHQEHDFSSSEDDEQYD